MPSIPPDDRSSVHPDSPPGDAGIPAGSELPSQPHDAFFKSIFMDPVRAAAALRAILPENVSGHIDWNSLEAGDPSSVDQGLRQRHGDLMFSATLRGHEACLWLLFEHQSTVDRWMPLRMLEMAVQFLKGWRKQPKEQHLPAILPIVLYQGTTRWRAPHTLAELYNLSEDALKDLSEFLPSLRFVLGDLSNTPDDKLMKGPGDDLVRVALVVMKHVTSEHLLDLLARLDEEIKRLLATEHGRDGLWTVLVYIGGVRKIKLHALIDHVKLLVGPELAKTMESYDETLKQKLVENQMRLAREEGQQKLLLRQLARRFGALPEAVTARVMDAAGEELERWGDRILDAKTLDDVFAEP